MGGPALSGAAEGGASPLLELDEPLADLEPTPGDESLRIAAAFGGESLGALELPVCDGAVSAAVIADAAADLFAWEVLRRFFERGLYPELRAKPTAWLAARELEDLISPAEIDRLEPKELHDRVGWGVFLQELWGERGAPGSLYARPRAPGRRGRLLASLRRRPWHRLEVSEEATVVRGPADVVVSAGGAPLGIVPVEQVGPLEPGLLRGAITAAAGFELCRVAVREGLLGRRPAADERIGLRDLLARAARDAEERERPGRRTVETDVPRSIEPAPGWDRALAAGPGGAGALILARHGPDAADGLALGTSASRRAALPSGAVDELVEAARAAGQPVVRADGPGAGGAGALYAPELVWRRRRGAWRVPGRRRRRRATRLESRSPPEGMAGPGGRRHRFEEIFAARGDPWSYTSAYEQTKYELTLSLIPEGQPRRALEVGCAEGHFTALLAPRVGRLTAADISGIALERAAERCEPRSSVEFVRLDLVSDPLPGTFDLVVCSETLYFTGDRERLAAAARKLADAVAPGGHLLTANAHQVVDDPASPGFDWGVPFGAEAIGEALSAAGSLSLVRELRAPLYRVQLFRRADGAGPSPSPEIVEIEQPTEVPDHIAGTVRWTGGSPGSAAGEHGVVTERLPILAYHRVAASGEPGSAAFRIGPDGFEEQLDYLRSAGFRAVGLETWRRAMEGRQPLPGRAVMITFDDGYRDFAEHAWPLLRRYGFGAALFVVTDEVGGWNRWDEDRGERVPLLDWDELARLRDQGLEVGSHSATHSPLTGLHPAEIVREAARSRAEIARRLGEPPLAFAYPYGDAGGLVQHLVGAIGYRHGLTMGGVRCRLQDRLLAMPRIEVAGDDALPALIAKLGR